MAKQIEGLRLALSRKFPISVDIINSTNEIYVMSPKNSSVNDRRCPFVAGSTTQVEGTSVRCVNLKQGEVMPRQGNRSQSLSNHLGIVNRH